MKFRQAHKTTTYMVVLSSFFAVASSGLLSPILLALSTIGIVLSWFWESPRLHTKGWNIGWTVFAALAFAYEVLSVLAGAEILFAGSNFLIVLLLVKLFSRVQSKDYLHIYILSFLMLTAGTVLNAEITYGIFFLCYVISSTWVLILFHLKREMEENFFVNPKRIDGAQQARLQRVMNSERIVGRKFFWGTGFVALLVFGSALSLFLLFPRIGFGFFFDKGRGGITMAGFSDGVRLGGHGLIKQDTTVVMRVKVGSDYQGRNAPSIHWRGVAFNHYSGGLWSRNRFAPDTRQHVSVHQASTTHHLLYAEAKQNSLQLKARNQAGFKQEIYLEPVGYDVLFGASLPLAFSFPRKGNQRTRAGRNDELRRVHSAGIKYTVYSDPTPPKASLLREAPNTMPPGYEVYLQLPDEFPECDSLVPLLALSDVRETCRVRDLARFITKDATNNYDKAKAIETWLKTTLGYTLQQESPGDIEPVEYFLFDRQKGHCEYFSSAMAVMARSVGVPVRNVNGFSGGEWNEYSEYIAVRAGDAHSWVEVYFDGQGWVTFDPTPAGESDLMGRGDSGILGRMRRMADTLRFKWFKWVIEYDLYAQLKLFKNIGKSIKGSANTYFKAPLKRLKTWAKHNRKTAGGIAIAFALLAALYGLRKRRNHDFERLAPRASKRARDPVVSHYLSALRGLSKRGYHRDDATTPREFATRLSSAKLPGAAHLQALTEMYYEVEYGPGTSNAADRAAEHKEKLLLSLKENKVRQKRGSPAI